MVWYSIILIIYFIIVAITGLRIILDVYDPAKSVSWLFVIIFIPVFGLILYRIIGRNVRKEKRFRKLLINHENQLKSFISLGSDYPKRVEVTKNIRLIKLLESNGSSHLQSGNKIEVLQNGVATFDSLFLAIKQAKESIHLDFYIVESGKLLDKFLDLFEKKRQEGVTIRMVYDDVGSWSLDKRTIRRFVDIGVELKVFAPIRIFKIAHHLNYRNHRKIVIIDNKIAFTGGMNISDKYVEGDENLGFWRDTFVRVEGPSVKGLQRIFLIDWYISGGAHIDIGISNFQSNDEGIPVQIVSSGPDSSQSSILQQFFTMITDAQSYVYISTPYLIPDLSIITALKTSALSGVDVRLLLPSDSDSKILRWGMMSFLEELINAGTKVYLYNKGFMHSKVIIADDNMVSIGTANMDVRSFETNFEVNVMIYDTEVCKKLKQDFFNDIEDCIKLDKETYPKLPLRNKLMESLSRLLSPLL